MALSADHWQLALPPERFAIDVFLTLEAFLQGVQQHSDQTDGLLVIASGKDGAELELVAQQLCSGGFLLPAVLVLLTQSGSREDQQAVQVIREQGFYHTATLIQILGWTEFQQAMSGSQNSAVSLGLMALLDQAMALFLQLSPTCGLPEGSSLKGVAPIPDRIHTQQARLAEKLRDQLGYKGVYYHRDPQRFFRNLSAGEQQQLLQRLRGLYQAVVLDYFQLPQRANLRTDELVALAFFADMGVSQILELHMGLMEDFSKQLKIEGRNEEILLDYRITLIDVISQLSEMYRRAVPRSPQTLQPIAPLFADPLK